MFKKLGKHWLGSMHLTRECGASLKEREYTREKKVDMGENFSPSQSVSYSIISNKQRIYD